MLGLSTIASLRRRAAIAAALALAPGFVSAGPDGFAPDAKAAQGTGAALQGATWIASGPGWSIALRALDDAERLNYISRSTGHAIDPFATKPGEAPRFWSFLLVVENTGDATLQFNPIHSWLVTNRKKIQSPIALTDVQFDYRIAGAGLPPAYERIGPALLDDARPVAPGARIDGLLVYRRVEEKTKRFRVDVRLTLGDGTVVDFEAPYRRQDRPGG